MATASTSRLISFSQLRKNDAEIYDPKSPDFFVTHLNLIINILIVYLFIKHV